MRRLGSARLLLLCVLTVLLGMPSALRAQEHTVTGTVTARQTEQPFPGVRVSVKGTLIATVTDSRGAFTLRVPGDATTLVFQYLGYRTIEEPVADQVTVTMQLVPIGLEGIVVTALGVHREKASLGYSVQDVMGEDLTEVPDYNLLNALHGKVAGVHLTQAGPTGGSTRIVIRGSSSITGNNQPLFVVDGIPIDNSSGQFDYALGQGVGDRNLGYGGLDYGNGAQDIDPNNIESISVLKGAAAAALYGSRAANGAVVISTKSGQAAPSRGLGMTANISVTMEDPLRLPNYQNEYGQGIFGEFQWVDGEGGGLWDFVDESWGPKLDGRLIDQFTGPQQPWVPQPDNVRSFFRTGVTLNTNVAIARASEDAHVRLSLTRNNQRGMSPGNNQERWGLLLRGGAEITERLSADASLNYIDEGVENRPGTGYDEDNPMQSFIWFGRQVDMDALRNFRCYEGAPTPCTDGGQFNWNYNYHNNPFWEALVNTNADERDRVIGSLSLAYQFTDWLSVSGRVGRDWYRHHRKRVTGPFSLDDQGDGSFGEESIYRTETTSDLLVTATQEILPKFTMDVTVGGGVSTSRYEFGAVQVARLTVPGIYTIDNAAVTPDPTDYLEEREIRGLYGSLSLNYGGYLNLDVTGRNDWSSTLPKGANSYFYPSVSAAVVFSDALGLQSSFFSSGKVRASWTRVGNDAAPYQLASVFTAQQQWGQTPIFAVSNSLANADLKPEKTTAWEVGTDLGFFDERLGFVLTYYDRTTVNQILGVEVSRASGVTEQVLNAGEVQNRGWELFAQMNPVQTRGFSWDVTVNWSKNTSKVTDLYGDLETLVLGTYWSLNIEARKGEPYGVMFGNGYLRNEDGDLLLTAGGMPRQDPERRILGNYNPDWFGGIQNRFRFGPVDLSVLVDGQMGGDIFSVTNWFGEYAGVLESTLRGRENDFCDPGIIVDGILPDGTRNTSVAVCPQDYFGRNFNIQEASIDDASYIKLREVRLGYELPTKWVRWLGFNGANVALIGRNLALWSKIDNIDPETAFDASNIQGIEFGQFPSARSFGFALTLR